MFWFGQNSDDIQVRLDDDGSSGYGLKIRHRANRMTLTLHACIAWES